MKKRTKIIVTVVFVLIVLFFCGGIAAGNVFYNLALNPDQDRSVVFGAEHNSYRSEESSGGTKEEVADVQEAQAEDVNLAGDWFEAAETKAYDLESYDGLKLHATAVTGNSEKWVVLCHGYGGWGTQMVYSAYEFSQRGYNVLMPDARGHGESEGDYIGMGWDERKDITGWINYILELEPDAEIALYGVSMGGATVMMTSGEDLPDNVKVIVEDCGYSSVWGEFSYQLKMLFKLPTFPVMNFSSLVTKVRSGWWLEEGSAVKQLAKNKTPMMFIHGDADTFVPFEMLETVYEAANVPKKKLIVEGAGHGGAAGVMGDAYWDAVFEFVGEYIS